MGFDLSKYAIDNLLQDFIKKPIEIKGVSERYKIEIRVIDTKPKDNKKGTGNVPQRRTK